MEKKAYMMPLLKERIVETENQLLAASPGLTFDDESGTGTGTLNDDDAEGDGLGKDFAGSVWDD